MFLSCFGLDRQLELPWPPSQAPRWGGKEAMASGCGAGVFFDGFFFFQKTIPLPGWGYLLAATLPVWVYVTAATLPSWVYVLAAFC